MFVILIICKCFETLCKTCSQDDIILLVVGVLTLVVMEWVNIQCKNKVMCSFFQASTFQIKYLHLLLYWLDIIEIIEIRKLQTKEYVGFIIEWTFTTRDIILDSGDVLLYLIWFYHTILQCILNSHYKWRYRGSLQKMYLKYLVLSRLLFIVSIKDTDIILTIVE